MIPFTTPPPTPFRPNDREPGDQSYAKLSDWMKQLWENIRLWAMILLRIPKGTGFVHVTDGVQDEEAVPFPEFPEIILPDGVYGDITVGGGGTDFQINPLTVGTPELIDKGVTNAKLRDSFGLSVMGRPINSLGPPSDIIASVDGTVFQRLGAVVGFFGLSGGNLADGSIDYVKIVSQPASTMLGRGDSAGSGPPEVITLASMLQIVGTELQVLFPALSIPNNFVTNAMLRDSAALSVIGRSINSPGDPAGIPAILNSNAVLRESERNRMGLGWN